MQHGCIHELGGRTPGNAGRPPSPDLRRPHGLTEYHDHYEHQPSRGTRHPGGRGTPVCAAGGRGEGASNQMGGRISGYLLEYMWERGRLDASALGGAARAGCHRSRWCAARLLHAGAARTTRHTPMHTSSIAAPRCRQPGRLAVAAFAPARSTTWVWARAGHSRRTLRSSELLNATVKRAGARQRR